MSRYRIRNAANTAWVDTRGSGAGAPAPLAPEVVPDLQAYDDRGVYLAAPVAQTYPGGMFSVVGRIVVAEPRTFSLVLLQITAPNGARFDGGFRADEYVEDTFVVRALDQKAAQTGTWTARLAYSDDAGSTYFTGPSTGFAISSLT